MKKLTIAELNKQYREAEECDKGVYADQRSNLQLVAGEHYSKKNSKYWDRIRDNQGLSQEQKLRLTKNHVYKISKIRTNIILSHAAGVRVLPSNESELQDQKSAELNQSVWEHGKEKLQFRKRVHEFASDFFNIGEVAAKLYFDPSKGEFKGYEQAVDEMGGPIVDEMGQPVAGEKAIFTGAICSERIFGMNLLRDPAAKSMDESPFLGIRRVINVDKLKEMVGDDEEKLKMIAATKDETYVVFDSVKNDYFKDAGVTTLREWYFRPCPEYPQGYYYIFIDGGILWDGELPFGLFPILYQGHDEMQTTARHKSPLKQLRPNQIEINRAASKVAEQQITLGDDKIVLVNGSKMSKGSEFPGLRSMTVTGQAPVVVSGRAGDQYFPYIEAQIAELYDLAELSEVLEDQGQSDPWGELFKSVKQKKKFIVDAEKFEFFLKDYCQLYLALAKNYWDEDMVIQAVGRNEAINITEFKNTSSQCYQIKVEPMSDDIETMMGKQLMLNHVLQYSSGQLSREDIGKLIRLMPYANNEKSFDDFTLNYDRATNMILQLDRGQAPTPNMYDDGPYMIKRLTARMSQGDFDTLHPEIKTNYEKTVSLYEDLEAEKQKKLHAAEADFIPTDGPMIKVGWYIKDPTNSGRSIQATLPANSINWLVDRLEQQGTNQQQLMSIHNVGALSEIAAKFKQQGPVLPGQGQLPNFQGGMQ